MAKAPRIHSSRLYYIRRVTTFVFAISLLVGVAKTWQNRRPAAEVSPSSFDEIISGWTTVTSPPFIIQNPYAEEGEWYQVQLHTHTNNSLDGKWSVEESLRAYRDAGYDFVAITDHDVITRPLNSGDELILIPAEENTVPFPFWPLGQHAIFLFTNTRVRSGNSIKRFMNVKDQGGIVQIAHPNWVGNLGFGRWEMKHLLAADQFTLMEVYNPYSDYSEDTATWHETVVRRGPEKPVWAVAVDDAHNPSFFHLGRTMVKAESRTLESLQAALVRGSLYPTTGPLLDFFVRDGSIVVHIIQSHIDFDDDVEIHSHSEANAEFIFIDAMNKVVHAVVGTHFASYTPTGDEGFIRIEIIDHHSRKRGWSQPFWLVGNTSLQ